MSIISSTVKIYDANQTLVETLPVIGDVKEATSTNLSPGTQYYATVESVDDQQQSSGESAPYQFFTLPQVNFTGTVTKDSSGFIRQMTNTTDSVQVIENGIVWDTNSGFTNPTYTSGTMVTGLTENTTYYYRPYCIDEFNRRWVNDQDTDSVTTLYAVPTIDWITIYGTTVGTFSALINISSTVSLTNVVALVTNSGNTTTHQLSVIDGRQTINVTGLDANTTYDIVIKATNSGGDGYSNAVQFTTQMSSGDEMYVEIIPRNIVSNVDNTITAQSVAQYNVSECTIVKHYVDVFENETHSGQPVFEYDGDDNYDVTAIFQNVASPDTTYWLNSKIEYTIGTDPTIYTVYSEPVQIRTYSLLKFTNIRVTYTTADIDFVVEGSSQNTEVEYSADGVTWNSISVPDPQGGTLELNWLQLNHTYYLRGRSESAAGIQEWVEDTFTTL